MRSTGFVGVGDLTGVVPAEDEGENVLRSIRSRGKRKLVTVVDAEFERAVLVTVLGDWLEYNEARVAGTCDFRRI